MSALTDLIEQVNDQGLRERLLEEASRLEKQKKFGLVFEEHLPECTPLYDIPVKKGRLVARKKGNINEIFTVIEIKESLAVCVTKNGENREEIPLKELVTVAEFGTPIYPCLQMIDSVSRAPESDLWHALIEADNYHALQLLEYLYAGKVDCIYIDPPYNTGAKDWKYNNDYVDSNDSYRHSKWLSMMQKRLKIAKRLLNPADSVLIVTIDEKEYLHLGCLLEEMFPEARIQMVSTLINSGGVARESQFSRTDEYVYIVSMGTASPSPLELDDEWTTKADIRTSKISWRMLSRSGSNSSRSHSPGCFYPIFVSNDGTYISSVGRPIGIESRREEVSAPEGTIAIWPIHNDGTEGCWQMSPEKLEQSIELGYVRLGRFNKNGMTINYLNRKEIEKVNSSGVTVLGRRSDKSLIIDDSDFIRKSVPGTQWRINSHNALIGGTNLLKAIFVQGRFTYPKSHLS